MSVFADKMQDAQVNLNFRQAANTFFLMEVDRAMFGDILILKKIFNAL